MEMRGMTYTITLDPKTEASIARKAQVKGVTLEDYLKRLAEDDARSKASVASSEPRPMAQIMQELLDEDLLTGYGDPSFDSPDLARQLRERFQRRDGADRSLIRMS